LRPDAHFGRDFAAGGRGRHALHPHRLRRALPRRRRALPLPRRTRGRARAAGGPPMISLWYAFVAAMLAIYVVLDGFDFGAGIAHLFVARNDAERRQVLSAIGPIWDGNEVWLIAAGGTLFFAFPKAYAVGFSGFYLPLMLVLWLLILRGI